MISAEVLPTEEAQNSTEESIEQEEITIEKQEPKGPIIICVDTSGSMHDTPENIRPVPKRKFPHQVYCKNGCICTGKDCRRNGKDKRCL